MTKRSAFSLVELLVVIAIVGALLAFSLPAVQAARDTATRMSCQSQTKQIALACLAHESVHRTLPRGKTPLLAKDDPLITSTWLFRILPFAEQNAVYDAALDHWKTVPVGSMNPPHTGFATPIPLYACPADWRPQEVQVTHQEKQVALTSYVGSMGPNWHRQEGALIADHAVRMAEITDGTSVTLLFGERPPSPDFWFGWWYSGMGQFDTGSADMLLGVAEENGKHSPYTNHCPRGPYPYRDGHPEEMCDVYHFWSLHAGGANFALADGSVHFVPYAVDPDVLIALSTRAGGETGSLP
jgi:prepilin-type N-terminal cleavage/methylation domain-containing protein/prepilin-type processing-associated H-X9-DG protein